MASEEVVVLEEDSCTCTCAVRLESDNKRWFLRAVVMDSRLVSGKLSVSVLEAIRDVRQRGQIDSFTKIDAQFDECFARRGLLPKWVCLVPVSEEHPDLQVLSLRSGESAYMAPPAHQLRSG